MPTYEYECAACGHAFEEYQSITALPLAVCPKCKKKKLARLVGGGSGFIFKGSGFYENDYKKKKGKPDAPCAGDKGSACASCPAKKHAHG